MYIAKKEPGGQCEDGFKLYVGGGEACIRVVFRKMGLLWAQDRVNGDVDGCCCIDHQNLGASAMVQVAAGYWTPTIIGRWHGHKCKLTPYILLPAIDGDWFHNVWVSNGVETTGNSEWRRSRRYNGLVGLVWLAKAAGGCCEIHMLSSKSHLWPLNDGIFNLYDDAMVLNNWLDCAKRGSEEDGERRSASINERQLKELQWFCMSKLGKKPGKFMSDFPCSHRGYPPKSEGDKSGILIRWDSEILL